MDGGTSKRIPELDGLRGIAILMVLFHHLTPYAFRSGSGPDVFMRRVSSYGGSGVDLFFVLSGFLITGILVESHGSTDYFSRFLWRRCWRIFPVFYAFMIPVCLTMGWLFTKIARPWFLLYLRNWRGPDATSDGLLGHLWSLAVEEQFYLAWAFVIFFLSRRNLWRLTVTLLAAGPLIRLWLHCESISGYMIFRVTPARMDALLMGALIAMAFRDGIDLAPAAKAGATAGIAALCVLPPDVNVLKTQIFLPSATSILFGSCLVLAVEYRPAWLHSRRWARIAQYSYSMYVIHLLVAVWVFSVAVAIGLPPRTVALPLAVLCVYAVASLLWRVIERPAFRIRDRHFVLQRSLGTPNEATQALAGSTTERAI